MLSHFRYLLAGRDYPAGLDYVREKTKQAFRENSHLTSEEDILKAVGRGRWYLANEIIPIIQFKKYRSLRERYQTDSN